MLPGGLSVIGVFALAPPAMMTAAQAKLRQVHMRKINYQTFLSVICHVAGVVCHVARCCLPCFQVLFAMFPGVVCQVSRCCLPGF